MRCPRFLILSLAMAAAVGLPSVPARAQTAPGHAAAPAPPVPVVCPEGRMADGRCVDPTLARLARQQVVCFTQIKLSYIACPGTLPSADFRYKYPYTVVTERQREINILYERQSYQDVFGATTRVRTTTLPVTITPVTTRTTAR